MASDYIDMNNPAVNPFMRTAAADPAAVRAGQRQQIASALHGAGPEARGHAKKLVAALDTIAGTSDTHSVIRGTAKAGGDGKKNAAVMLAAQQQTVNDASDQAQESLKALKSALLAAVVSVPQGVSAEQIADKKADLCAALEAAGKQGANIRAQQILAQAMANNDALMAYVACSPDVMGYRAEALGYRLEVLQGIYAAKQVEKVGLRPLMASEAVPGAELIALLPAIKETIDGHTQGATQALAQLAAECNL